MKLTELQKRRFELQKRSNEITDAVEARGTKMTDEELVEMEAINNELRSIKAMMEARELAPALAKNAVIHDMCEEIRAVMRKEKDEAHINLRAAATAVTAMNSTTTAAAQASFVEGVIAPLQNTIHKLVGTKIRTGMKHGAKWVVPGVISATINDEAVELAATQISMSALSTSPKDVGVQVNSTNQALEYSDIDLITEVILPAIQTALETIVNKWMFSTTAVATGCAGVFVNVETKNRVTFASTAPTYKELQKLIGKVRARGVKNDGTFAFVMSSEMAAELRGTSRDTGSGRMIIEDDKISGIPVFETEDIENGNNGAAKYVGFGRFSDHLIGQFGDVTLRFDNSSAKVAAANLAYWTVHMFLDQKVLRQEAFALGTATIPAAS